MIFGHTEGNEESCGSGLTSVPALGERCWSVLLMLIIHCCQSSTDKWFGCPACAPLEHDVAEERHRATHRLSDGALAPGPDPRWGIGEALAGLVRVPT